MRIHLPGELAAGGKVVPSAVRIGVVDRLGKIELLQKMSAKPAYIRRLHREPARQFALHREIERFGIRRLDFAVQPPGNRKITLWRGIRKTQRLRKPRDC